MLRQSLNLFSSRLSLLGKEKWSIKFFKLDDPDLEFYNTFTVLEKFVNLFGVE